MDYSSRLSFPFTLVNVYVNYLIAFVYLPSCIPPSRGALVTLWQRSSDMVCLPCPRKSLAGDFFYQITRNGMIIYSSLSAFPLPPLPISRINYGECPLWFQHLIDPARSGRLCLVDVQEVGRIWRVGLSTVKWAQSWRRNSTLKG